MDGWIRRLLLLLLFVEVFPSLIEKEREKSFFVFSWCYFAVLSLLLFFHFDTVRHPDLLICKHTRHTFFRFIFNRAELETRFMEYCCFCTKHVEVITRSFSLLDFHTAPNLPAFHFAKDF